jgi:hypothetical protein
MILQIPKLKYSFIKNGFDKLHYNALFEPTRILGTSTDQIYLDSVLVTMLTYAKQSKKILDLGSYFGMLPFIVEDLYRKCNVNFKIDWTLVDNCSYVTELYQHITGKAPLSDNFMSLTHSNEWKKNKITPTTQNLFDSYGDSCLPPINAEQFQLYWQKLASDYLDVTCPSMTMYEDLSLLEGQKFDFVVFDLSAGRFKNSVDMFGILQNHITDDAIIIIDDVTPSHPETMAVFQHVMKTYNYAPVAFSPGKIAVMRPEHKEEFLLKAESKIAINEINFDAPSFYCYYKVNEVWGPYLQLRTT